MTGALIVVTSTGRRHWLAEAAGSRGYRTICGRLVTSGRLLPEDDAVGVTCPQCRARRDGTR